MSEARVALTAELVARAIIASAASYGDAPDRWAGPGAPARKRALAPAADAVAIVWGRHATEVARLVGISTVTISYSARRPTAAYTRARAAAAEALQRELSGSQVADPPASMSASPSPASRELPQRGSNRPARPSSSRGVERADRGCLAGKPQALTRDTRGPTPPGGGSAPPSLADRVLGLLDGAHRDSLDLARRAQASELEVIEALKALKRRGRVASVMVSGGARPVAWGRTPVD